MSYLHTILWTSCFPNHIGEMQSGLPHREINAFFLRSRKSILNLHSLNSVLVTTKLQCFLMEEINVSVIKLIKLERSSIQESILKKVIE